MLAFVTSLCFILECIKLLWIINTLFVLFDPKILFPLYLYDRAGGLVPVSDTDRVNITADGEKWGETILPKKMALEALDFQLKETAATNNSLIFVVRMISGKPSSAAFYKSLLISRR